MQVKLLTSTSDVNIDGQLYSPEELIVYIARVSNPNNQANKETASKLISYLVKNKHWSPFEMVDMTFEIVTSRAIAQQLIRHRSMSFQEFSQRYSEVQSFEPVRIRKSGATNRQSSLEQFDPIIGMTNNRASSLINEHLGQCADLYLELLKEGVAKECARMVLPMTSETTLYMKGSVRSWITYLNVRLDEHTQMEHRDIAIEIAKVIEIEYPNIARALNMFNDYKGMFM